MYIQSTLTIPLRGPLYCNHNYESCTNICQLGLCPKSRTDLPTSFKYLLKDLLDTFKDLLNALEELHKPYRDPLAPLKGLLEALLKYPSLLEVLEDLFEALPHLAGPG